MIDLLDYGPSEAEQRDMLRSLLEVGPSKPIGYLPLSAIRAAKSAPEIIAMSALADGLAAVEFPPGACCSESGALWLALLLSGLTETIPRVRSLQPRLARLDGRLYQELGLHRVPAITTDLYAKKVTSSSTLV
jgi:hypothetical protein